MNTHYLFDFLFDTVKIFASRIHVRMEDHAMERTDHVIVRLIVRDLNANPAMEVIFNPFLQRIMHYIQSLPCEFIFWLHSLSPILILPRLLQP